MEQTVKQLFIDFILNRCSQAQLEEVKRLIDHGAHHQEWEAAAMETIGYFSEADHSRLTMDEDKIFLRVQEQIGRKTSSTPLWKKLSVAAVLLLIGSLAAMFLSERQSPAIHQELQTTAKKTAPVPSQEHKWIKLPDGSSVQLNSNSRLDFPEQFDGPERIVSLVGEAYFDIRHDPSKPFIIHTGKIRTTVLGTAFNIKAYQADTAVTVTVSRGKVKVEKGTSLLAVLHPDQQISWKIDAEQPRIAHVNASIATEWKNDDLIMDDISLADAAVLIEKRFGVKVIFSNEQVKSCRFTAAFLSRNDISQVLNVISDITGARLNIKNNQVTISGPGC